VASTAQKPWPRLFARIVAGGALFIGLGGIAVFEVRRLDQLTQLETDKTAVVAAQVNLFNDFLHRLRADLLILSGQTELDAVHPDAKALADVAREYAEFVRAIGHYSSIRLVGVDGRQLVEVLNGDSGEVHVAINPPGDRFRDALALERARRAPGGLLMESDIAREAGAPRPLLRFATTSPAVERDERKLLELTYRADTLFERLAQYAVRSDSVSILLTHDGYWRAEDGSSPRTWRYYDLASGAAPLALAYPEAWARITEGESGTVRIANGFFVFRTVHPAIKGFWGFEKNAVTGPTPEAPEWRVISFISPETTAAIENRILESLVPSALAALLTWGLISWSLAVYWSNHYFRQARLLHQATTDPLTGALNRAAFDERLRGALARFAETGESCALIFVDLDAFKAINDTYGHDAGDACLRETVIRIRAAIRDNDIVGRIGGDEFGVVLAPIKSREAALAVLAKIAARLEAAPAPYADTDEPIRASLGLAICPADGTTAEMLLRIADKAMYGAKRSRSPGVHPEDPSA
jgi:diguanylate cyclase (GGDEF)-like protein